MSVFVLKPEFAFPELVDRLAASGWQMVDDPTAPQPLIDGEPELASFAERGGDHTLHYAFMPATGLRRLQVEGPHADRVEDELGQRLPLSSLADAEALIESTDTASIILGLQMVDALGGHWLAGRVLELVWHPDSLVQEQAARTARKLLSNAGGAAFRALADWKQAHPDGSLAFRAVGDPWDKLQLLRWLMADRDRSNPDIEAVLRTALEDEDWEVRVTAMICAARLRARSVLAEVARAELPQDTAAGVNKDERRMLRSIQLAAIELLETGQGPPDISSAPTTKSLMHAHILRCVDGLPVRNVEKTFLYIRSLSTPLPDEVDAPVNPPVALNLTGETYRLADTEIEFVWVPPVEHWLGEDLPRMQIANPIRRASPEFGFFIATQLLGDARAGRSLLLNFSAAAEHCKRMSEDFDVRIGLPTADQWEMAARGPDGRRFPWGNNARRMTSERASPWGMKQAVGVVPQWTTTRELEKVVTCGGPKQWMCAERQPMEPRNGLAALRFVIEDNAD